MHRAYAIVIAGLLCHAARAESHFDVTAGFRDEAHAADLLPAAGLSADFGRDEWLFRPELGISLSLDSLGGNDEAELSAGCIAYWRAAAFGAHFGVGALSLSTDLINDSATNPGLYVHGGLSWGTSARRAGFDIRYVKARESNLGGAPVGGDYMQLALLLGW
jgi:hypothetical protein